MKRCCTCKQEKELIEFHKNKGAKDGLHWQCKLCCKIKHAKLYKKERSRDDDRRLKREVVAAYGNKCACCDEEEYAFLTLDHVKGGGGQERKRVGASWAYRDARRRNFPPDYQVLCYNCNAAKYKLGTCPHQISRVENTECPVNPQQ